LASKVVKEQQIAVVMVVGRVAVTAVYRALHILEAVYILVKTVLALALVVLEVMVTLLQEV
jgi:regulator of protease activity HflC (stomatin/prohibitin superfamily)